MRCSFVGSAGSFIAIIEGTVGVLKVLGCDNQALQQQTGIVATKRNANLSKKCGKKLKRTMKILFDGVGSFE